MTGVITLAGSLVGGAALYEVLQKGLGVRYRGFGGPAIMYLACFLISAIAVSIVVGLIYGLISLIITVLKLVAIAVVVLGGIAIGKNLSKK